MKTCYAALLAVLLVSCASYRPQPIDLSTQAQSLQARRLDASGLDRYAARLGYPHWPPTHWTRSDPAITKALAQFGRSGVPLYLVYPHGKRARVLPQVLSAGIVVGALPKPRER